MGIQLCRLNVKWAAMNLKAIFNYSHKKERGLGVNFTPSKKIGQWRQHPRVTAPHVVPGGCVT